MLRMHRFRPFLIPLAFLCLAGLLFSVTGRDDVFKTLFAAENFANSGALLNYNGEAIEQSSSLLIVLLLGLLKAMTGIEIGTLSLMVSLGAFVGSVVLAVRIASRIQIPETARAWLPWLLASLPFGLYWSWSGMETTLSGLCLLWTLLSLLEAMERGSWIAFWLSLPFTLLVRPENSLLLGVAVVLAGILVPGQKKWLVKSAFALGIAIGALLVLRWLLFGTVFPLPVEAKAEGLSFFRAYKGLGYVYRTCIRHPDFLLLGLAAAVGGLNLMLRRRGEGGGKMLVASFAIAGSLFAVLSGGDWMESGRFWVPVLPLFLLMALEIPLRGSWWLAALLTVQLLGTAWIAHAHSSGRPMWSVPKHPTNFSFFERANRFHFRDIATIQALEPIVDSLYLEKKRPISLLSQQAGMVIAHLSESHASKIHFTDLVGLSTTEFHQCSRTKDRGKGFGGLNMDLFYLLDDMEGLQQECGFSKPDLIFDLDNERAEKRNHLRKHGYRIAYEQSGEILNPSLLPGLEVSSIQFIALSP